MALNLIRNGGGEEGGWKKDRGGDRSAKRKNNDSPAIPPPPPFLHALPVGARFDIVQEYVKLDPSLIKRFLDMMGGFEFTTVCCRTRKLLCEWRRR
ncbi:hypothetical protein GWI33_007960 [Rhynchophorus ferrugineus]|uniref:Uncharacterized protein n=1 Tax=Rhynchophorus ferrugineus TaxID=354439 RepID=A0A834IFD7_RHYFE|nr:hypothetical protein GWI33_007960 [Rhynchophorus ferrugineus]